MSFDPTEHLLVSIEAPHFSAGIVSEHGFVIGAAPIVKWMFGKPLLEVLGWCDRKGYRTDILPVSSR